MSDEYKWQPWHRQPQPEFKPNPHSLSGWDDEVEMVTSDGGPTSYYELPEHATELRHLISHKGMSFARGNLFKALYRLGEKDGTSVGYDLNKLQLFLDDMREMIARGERL